MTAYPRSVPVSGARARLDAAVRLAAGALLWLALLLVTYWWVADRGLQDLTGWTTGLTSLGRITGLVASVLLLVQVLAMARVPLLERAFGQDKLAKLHRLIGFTSFDLMVAHIGLITWGYAAGSIAATPGTLWSLTWNFNGMLLAVAGTACLVMVVVTSVKAARRRLRYESWHLLHLYAYLGAGLALPHQLWTGQELMRSPARAAFWWTLWGVSAGAVLVWRVGRPLWVNLRHRLVVTSVVPEAPGIHSVYVTGHRLDRMRVEAGQFLSWRFLAGRGWSRANPYSLSAAPDGRSLRITVQDVGDGSGALRHVRPGTRVLVEGSFGRLSARARTRRKVALIGAGVGMAPLRSLAEGLDVNPGELVVLQRHHDPHAPLFGRELDTLAHERGIRLLRLPGPRRAKHSWLGPIRPADVGDLDALLAWVPDIAERDVFVCGPAGWVDLLRIDLQRAGLPPERLHAEIFEW